MWQFILKSTPAVTIVEPIYFLSYNTVCYYSFFYWHLILSAIGYPKISEILTVKKNNVKNMIPEKYWPLISNIFDTRETFVIILHTYFNAIATTWCTLSLWMLKKLVFHHRVVERAYAKSRISYRKCHAVRIQCPASRVEFNKGLNIITCRMRSRERAISFDLLFFLPFPICDRIPLGAIFTTRPSSERRRNDDDHRRRS